MFYIDEKVLKAYSSSSREISVRATFDDTIIVTGKHIKSFSVSDSVGNTDSLSLGNTCSKKLELDMLVPDTLTNIEKAKILMEIGILVDDTVEYTPLGVFFVEDYNTKNDYKSVKITAFDTMYKITDVLGDTYTCSLTSKNVTALQVINDICSQAGVLTDIPTRASSEVTKSFVRQAEGVLFDSGGKTYESLVSIGTTHLIPIPKGTSRISIEFHGINITYDKARVVFFKDPNMQTRYSSKEYSGMTFGDCLDFETGEQYIEGTIDVPTYSGMLYLGFHLGTVYFDETPDVTIKTVVTYSDSNYVNSNITIPNPEYVDMAARDVLGFMASILGCNAVINRSGYLTLKKYDITTNNIPYRQQYMGGLEKTNVSTLPIEYLTTGSAVDDGNEDSGTITVGSGSYGFNFENPFINLTSNPTTVAQNILNLYKGLEIMPCNIDYRGNPSIDCGDIIEVQDKDDSYHYVFVINNSISVTGGMRAKIDSSLKTDVKKDFIAIPPSKKVGRKVDTFVEEYGHIIEELVGVQGGYVQQVRDSSNVVRALAITEHNVLVKWDSAEGKVVVANPDDSDEPMWVWSYGGLSFSPNGGYSYDIAINMRGQIYANYLQSPLGYIGGWILNDEKIFQRVKVGTTTYEFTLKSDSSGSQTKKTIYADTFTENRNSDSPDADSYKTENFFIRRNGEIFLASGSVAGWNFDEESLYADYGNYRAYIQKPSASKMWVFSTQTKNADGGYNGTFYVTATGQCYVGNGLEVKGALMFDTLIKDKWGYSVISSSASNLVIGYGNYSNGLPTYLEGGDVYLRGNSSGSVYYQQGSTNRLTLHRIGWKFSDIDTDYTNRDTITSSGAMVLNANSGNNAFYVVASSIRLRNNTWVGGNLRISGETYIGFSAASGTVTLAVDKNGKITVPSSSARYKENITDKICEELDPKKLYDLSVKQYNYKNEYKDNELVSGTQIGIIAEEVDKIYPNACIYNQEGQPESWQDRIMIPAMLKLIQEQKEEIDTLKQSNEDIQNRLSSLEEIIKNLTKESD